jgi:hypothetical protein
MEHPVHLTVLSSRTKNSSRAQGVTDVQVFRVIKVEFSRAVTAYILTAERRGSITGGGGGEQLYKHPPSLK